MSDKKQSEKQAEEQVVWEREEGLPRQYVRLRGTKDKPDLAGKKVPLQCKSCCWFTQPHPSDAAVVEDEEGNEKSVSCNVAYFGDPEMGASPEDFGCEHFLHQEHRPLIKRMLGQSKKEELNLSPAQLRAMQVLNSAVNSALENADEESVKAAFSLLMGLHKQERDAVVGEWVGNILPSRSEKVVVRLGELYTITTRDGDTFEAVAVRSTKAGVSLTPASAAAQKKYGTSYKIAPELWAIMMAEGKIKVVGEDEEEGTVEDDD